MATSVGSGWPLFLFHLPEMSVNFQFDKSGNICDTLTMETGDCKRNGETNGSC